MTRWLLGLLLLAQVSRSGLMGPGAANTEHPALFSYFIREFFNEPWRMPGAYVPVRRDGVILVVLDAGLAFYLMRRRESA